MRYSKIFTRIWRSPDFRKLSDDGRQLFLYLLTSPHLNMVGFYYLPLSYIAEDMQWPIERVQEAFRECSDALLVKYDDHASVVLILKYLKWNPLQNENQAKGAAKILEELPPTPLFSDFKQCLETLPKRFQNYFETLLKQFQNRLETLPKHVTVTVTETETVTVEENRNNDGLSNIDTCISRSAAASENMGGERYGERGESGGGGEDFLTDQELRDENFAKCYRLFEREFGRPLSPIEAEEVKKIASEHPFDVVKEALRRAVASGILRLRYIRSILDRWKRANLRTLREVQEYEKLREQKKVATGNPQIEEFDPASLFEAQKKKREEKITAALSFIRFKYKNRLPPRKEAEKIAQGYGEDVAPEILSRLYDNNDQGSKPP